MALALSLLLFSFSKLLLLLLCVSVSMLRYGSACVHVKALGYRRPPGEVRGQPVGVASLSTILDPDIELSLPGLAASAFTP